MSKAKSVDESSFEAEVLNAGLPVLVDFWASWCLPCRALASTIDELADELADRLSIVKVNVQDVPDLPRQYEVMNIPTLLLFKDGEEIARFVGNKSKKVLLKELEAHL